jgi:excinuclease ABC subunit B
MSCARRGGYDVVRAIAEMEREMAEAAEAMEYERAALLRDQIYELKRAENPFKGTVQEKKRKPVAYHPGKGRPGGWRKKK